MNYNESINTKRFFQSLDFENGQSIPHLIGIENIEQLERIQGSKYVQSAVEDTYKQVQSERASNETKQ